jgi:hypothetical protein
MHPSDVHGPLNFAVGELMMKGTKQCRQGPDVVCGDSFSWSTTLHTRISWRTFPKKVSFVINSCRKYRRMFLEATRNRGIQCPAALQWRISWRSFGPGQMRQVSATNERATVTNLLCHVGLLVRWDDKFATNRWGRTKRLVPDTCQHGPFEQICSG